MNTDNILASTYQGCSQIWQTINKIKHLFKLGGKVALGNGQRIRFWTHWLLGDAPLTVCFPRLFDIYRETKILVA
jgi:hypothetical protein